MDIIITFDEFKSYILFEKQLTKNTYIEYVRDIAQFIDLLKENKINSIFHITRQSTLDFKMKLKEKGLSTRTISRKISALREFFKFLKGKYNFNEFEMVSPKFETTLPEIVSPQLIKKIILFMQSNNNPNKLRDDLIFKLIYTTGIRASEIIKIKIKDINFTDRFILINGKGNKQRLVPYPLNVNDELISYCKVLPTEYLFPLRRQTIWFIIKQIGKNMEIKLYPHKLRHSIATHLLENGANLVTIKKLLGHESINSTSIYTHLDVKHLRKEYDKFHPRSKSKDQKDEDIRNKRRTRSLSKS